jgi:small subunit ribosomal protein S6
VPVGWTVCTGVALLFCRDPCTAPEADPLDWSASIVSADHYCCDAFKKPSCHGKTVAAESRGGGFHMRHYEVMVILDPEVEERAVSPLIENFLNVVRTGGGNVEKVDTWGRRRLSYEINKKSEGIYSVIDLKAEPAVVKELDRQLNLSEQVLRTKVLRPDTH